MAIKDHSFGTTPETHTRGVETVTKEFRSRFATHGEASARDYLRGFGVEPSLEDVRDAQSAAAGAEYQRLRSVNPFAAASYAAVNPVHDTAASDATAAAARQAAGQQWAERFQRARAEAPIQPRADLIPTSEGASR